MSCLRNTSEEEELHISKNELGVEGKNRNFPGVWILGVLNANIQQ